MNRTAQAAFFDNHPDPMWVYDLESLAFLAVNDTAVRVYGYSRAEFLDMTLRDIHLSADQDLLEENIKHSRAAHQRSGIWRHRLKNGRVVHVDIVSHSLDYEGRHARLVAVRDISRLLEPDASLIAGAHDTGFASKRLMRQAAMLQSAQRLAGIGSWELDPKRGLLRWSDHCYSIFGIAPDRLAQTSEAFFDLVHPEDRAGLRARQAQAHALREGLDITYRIVRPDGTLRYLRDVSECAGTPEAPHYYGAIQDITQQQDKQAEVEQLSSLLRLAGRTARLGGWRAAPDSDRVIWTEETAAIHGVPFPAAPTLQEAIDFYAPPYRERIRKVYLDCVEQGRPFDETLQIVTRQGERIWVRALGEADRDATGRIIGVQGALQDITEMVQARERERDLSGRLLSTLENISDAFFTLDRDWRFTFINTQAERLLNRSAASLLGRNVWEEFPEAVGRSFQIAYERSIETGRTARFVDYYPGLKSWFQVNAYPSPDGLAVYFRDVTRERAHTERLRLLEAAVSRANDILLITAADPLDQPQGPRIVYVNDAFERITGYSREEAVGQTPRMLQGPRTQRDALDRIRQAVGTAEPVRVELLNYTKGGEEIWLECDIIPLFDDTGTLTHFVAVERDITQRKEAEAALRLSEERFQLVARATNDVIWDWKPETNELWWNDNLRSFGCDPDAAPPDTESWRERLHPEDRERVLTSIYGVINSDQPYWKEEYRFRKWDEAYATVIDRGFVMRDAQGRAIRVVGSMADVTAQRDVEHKLRQSQKLEAIGQLTGGVAHDFNNLLTVILGNGELLAEALDADPELQRLASMVAKAAQRGADLTNHLLAFARQQALEPRAVDVNDLISRLEELLRRSLKEDIDILIHLDAALWQAEVDPGQLEVALLNLALNSRDAMPDGGRLTIETRNVELDADYCREEQGLTPGNYVLLAVSDNGFGMTADACTQVFEPFFTTKEPGKGSGLGLSMVYGFVRQSGGHARIYSEVGVGTTIKLYLPRADREALPQIEPRPEALQEGDAHILVVEDDTLVREHLSRQLQSLGYRVTSAPNGETALALLRETDSFDLLLTDVIMPGGMNGRQLAAAALELYPQLPVLFTSGYTENAIVHGGRLDPGIHLLQKPYRRQELARKVHEVLAEKESR
ncbi:hybrid sensor histidine kinase/response regulator [Aquibaculum arenosum]|uniref:histidine kinase n=1 Tax=Aquibaculum arenosum TaxID=3032591 RepID=A0ABT5YHD1_9PROT|nr:PAS domain S-box protein [Fodinicurvata sp. CAU 1616]MDF2094356.1 PAS domain S-box protein [Fodinicurvata sp. CAU 1616]